MAAGATASGLVGIKLDTQALRDTGVVLREVSRGFVVDDNLLAIALEGIGSPAASGRPRSAGIWQLEKALTAFSGQWRVRRERVRERVEGLASTVTLVADHFDGADASLAGAIAPPAPQHRGDTRGRMSGSVWQ